MMALMALAVMAPAQGDGSVSLVRVGEVPPGGVSTVDMSSPANPPVQTYVNGGGPYMLNPSIGNGWRTYDFFGITLAFRIGPADENGEREFQHATVVPGLPPMITDSGKLKESG